VTVLGWLLHFTLAMAAETGPADVLTYPLGPGDELRVEVVGQPDMSGDLRVAADGTLTIPLARAVPVAGLTLDQARDAIIADLSDGYLRNPQVILDISTFASRQVAVSGGVLQPGAYPLISGLTTVSRVLLEAGGITDPNAPQAQIWRDTNGTREVIEVDLERLRRGDPAADLPLLPGDQVYVPLADQVFVDGQVQKPGAIAYRDGMTLTEAIIQAGSALGTARLSGVYIMRGGERMNVNLKRILRGKDEDVPLLPADRIYLPESVF
jgi:polysaccharide export outer membrane protein